MIILHFHLQPQLKMNYFIYTSQHCIYTIHLKRCLWKVHLCGTQTTCRNNVEFYQNPFMFTLQKLRERQFKKPWRETKTTFAWMEKLPSISKLKHGSSDYGRLWKELKFQRNYLNFHLINCTWLLREDVRKYNFIWIICRKVIVEE